MSLLLFLSFAAADPIGAALSKPVIDQKQPLVEVQVYTAGRVPLLPVFDNAREWQTYAANLRRRVLDEVVFRGEAANWRKLPLRVEWVETVPGGSDYEIRKFRVEVVPGVWLPGLLYRPSKPAARAPAVMNVNGHEKTGNATPYIQERCIHLARNGIFALNMEWFGRGQMSSEGFNHYRMPQIDLTGTSGLSLFYLAMKKGIDILESIPEVDRGRIAVTGLSGGGWQTIFISALDERVALANPVAGYSSYVTRAQWPDLDLGDSEQTPSDLASVADYTHLTALVAPRWFQVASNANDTCCFRADYAPGPLVQTGRTVWGMLQHPERFRYHLNFGVGHNYDSDNREAFYRLFRDAFDRNFPIAEKPLASPVRTAEQLAVSLPADNLDFNTLARRLSTSLPRAGGVPLRSLVRARDLPVDARRVGESGTVQHWQLKMDGAWTVPAVEIAAAQPRRTTIVVADAGRATASKQIGELVNGGSRVIAMDPFYFGESKIATKDYLFAILIAALGERPLGLQASQILAAARWARERHPGQPVALAAFGPRTSLAALVAAAIEPEVFANVDLEGSFKSLKDILDKSLTANNTPELFCFGLLEAYDIPQLAALAGPRVKFR
jgi:hypothetical protein